MKPVTPVIPGRTLPITEFAKYQQEYISLPSYRAPGDEGLVTSRWKLSWRERIRVLLTGNLWLQVMTFRHPLQPVKLSTTPPEIDQTETV